MCGLDIGMIVRTPDGLEQLCGCCDWIGGELVRLLREKKMDYRGGRKEECHLEGRRYGRLMYDRLREGGIRGCLLWGVKGRMGRAHLGYC